MASQSFTVEKGVPVPARSGGPKVKYPWADLEPGDSFVVPMADGQSYTQLQNSINSCARTAFGAGNYATRRTEDGKSIRVWRLA